MNWNIDPTIVALGGQLGANIGGAIKDYRDRQTLSSLGGDLAGGDYKTAAQKLIEAGDTDTGIKLLTLAQSQADSQGASQYLGNMSLGSLAPPSPASTNAPIAASPAEHVGQPMQLSGGKMLDSAREAIAKIESSGNYGALGPRTRTGDRAYGRYQVMGANIPTWTREVLGRSMSPQEFLSSREAQDAVFNAKFGASIQRYGSPQEAASVWFTGRPIARGGNAADVTGTTGNQYVQRFNNALGSGGRAMAYAPQTGQEAIGAAAPQQRVQMAGGVGMPQGQPDPNAIIARIAQRSQALARFPNMSPSVKAAIEQANKIDELMLSRSDKMVDREFQRNELPANAKEYEYARRQGYQGTFEQFKQLSRQQTTVNIDQKSETEFGKKTAEGIAKRFQDLSDEGASARTDMALLSQLNDLGQAIDTGGIAAVQNTLAQFGIKVGSNVGKVEAYGAIIDKLTPQQRVPGSGTTSDFDMKLFKSALPSLIKTPEGNSIVMSTLAGLAQQKIARAAIAERAQIGEIDYRQAVKEMQALPSPLADFKKFQSGEFAPKPDGAQKQGALKPAPQTELELARQAISSGRPKEQVLKMMRERGYEPSGL